MFERQETTLGKRLGRCVREQSFQKNSISLATQILLLNNFPSILCINSPICAKISDEWYRVWHRGIIKMSPQQLQQHVPHKERART